MPWMSIKKWKALCKIGPPARVQDDLPFRVLSLDAFSNEWETIGSFHTEEKALYAARAKARALEEMRATPSTPGEVDLQDRVFLEKPDGAKYRVLAGVDSKR